MQQSESSSVCLILQDKVVNSISELYSFMDGADSTLARKVLGEGGAEEGAEAPAQHVEEDAEAGNTCCRGLLS